MARNAQARKDASLLLRNTNNSRIAALDAVDSARPTSVPDSKNKKKVTIVDEIDVDFNRPRLSPPLPLSGPVMTLADPVPSGTGGNEDTDSLGEPPGLQRVSPSPTSSSRSSSIAPSLTSLVRDVSPTATSDSQSTVLANTRRYGDFPRVFEGIEQAAHIDLMVEPVQWSVNKWHVVFDLRNDLDPLHEFGAIDGILPGCSEADSLNLRDLVLRWSMPHCLCLWENLPLAVEEFASRKFTMHDLVPFDRKDVTFYSMLADRLMQFGQIILALTQVIQGLSDFLHASRNVLFLIDPNFVMLRLLAWHDNPTHMVLTLQVLQERAVLAVKHVKRLFNNVRRSLVVTHAEAQSISSFNSTEFEERAAYEARSPLSTVANFAVRNDSRITWDKPNLETMQGLVDRRKVAGKPDLKEEPYHHRAATKAIIAPDSVISSRQDYVEAAPNFPRVMGIASRTAADSISGHVAAKHSRSEFPTLPRADDKRPLKAAPASISSFLRNHSVSVLPGMGEFPSLPPRKEIPPHLVVPRIKSRAAGKTKEITPQEASLLMAVDSGATVMPTKADTGTTPLIIKPATSWTSYKFRTPGGPPGDGDDDDPDGPSGGGGPPRAPSDRSHGEGDGPPGLSPPPPPPPEGGDPPFGSDMALKGFYGDRMQAQDEWQMNYKINASNLPSWDGRGSTVIDYLSSMSGFARLGERMKRGMAQLAAHRWSGRAQKWWEALPIIEQEYFSQHWDYMLVAIRNQFLDETWIRDRTQEFEEMRFRQGSLSKETPEDFVQRRIRYHSFLFPGELDGRGAVARVLRTQPVEWGATLNEETCPSILELLTMASRMGKNLESQYLLNESLRQPNHSFVKSNSPAPSRFKKRHANLVSSKTGPTAALTDDSAEDSTESDDAKEVYSVQTQTRPRSKAPTSSRSSKFPEGKTIDGYSFARDDSVTSDRLPNGTCFICTSPKHFFRDCPHYGRFQTLRSANMIHVDWDPDLEKEYDREYLAMIVESKVSATSSTYIAFIENLRNAKEATQRTACTLHRTARIKPHRNERRRVLFESKDKVKALMSRSTLPPRSVRRKGYKSRENIVKVACSVAKEVVGEMTPSVGKNESSTLDESLPVGPLIATVVPAKKCRALPEGMGSLGSRALQIKGRVHSLDEKDIPIRLDSGADITLMSEDFYESIPALPKIREGLRMKLYHLTGAAKVLGYVRTTLFALATNGDTVSFELEAYVVRNMKVPLLIGEDFQTTYELGLDRHVTGHCEVRVGRDSPLVVAASSALSVDLGFDIRQAYVSQSFVRAKALSRNKARTTRDSKDSVVTAAVDVLLTAGAVHNVRIEGAFGDVKEWIVEKVIIGTDTQDVLAAPTTWINADHPYIPIANPSSRPWYIRAGDVVGYLSLPETLDNPSGEVLARCVASAESMRAAISASTEALRPVIGGTLREKDLASAANIPGANPDQLDDDPNWGPKTSSVPDDPLFGDVSKLVNLGPDIPAEVLPDLVDVLRRNANAFGVDGRLGQVNARVEVPLKPGSHPVSVPMYGASPAKREVIDKQVNAWFEAGVIEPSTSPWGFPVVVVYRNGKPRLVVDYRKLNAMTIPDEFPIPRQTEIIQALSGAQVLSSFDALAGFTQLEMLDEHKERTAFRCHLGLFQFRRMPFGLRNGPSIFQRIMQGVLSPFLWLFALVYIDDIVIFSRSWAEHLTHLDRVLGAISAAGITLSPAKCFVGFSSILLLGQKVSRLGLSTHREKVAAILDLERPRNASDLQKFLGMVVYFSQYIPFYSFIASPLFALFRKGVKWTWDAEHELAWQHAKEALSAAPVLGHPVQGAPYRLYTDASDFALGASLQQVQTMKIADLAGTPVYEKLLKAHKAGSAVPSLFPVLVKDVVEQPALDEWAPVFEETIVHVERVICYWSRTLKPAERNYSATEREALGAKEALVRFQPFIEGEVIILITDHAALQWARVYENANRRLAAWGAVFAAYPGLHIVHRPGRIHSNVDPLSRMPRIPPHNSPARDDLITITQDDSKRQLAQAAEDRRSFAPAAKAAFAVDCWEDIYERNVFLLTRRQKAEADLLEEQLAREPSPPDAIHVSMPTTGGLTSRDDDMEKDQDSSVFSGDDLPFNQDDHWTYPVGFSGKLEGPGEDWNRKAHLLVSMRRDVVEEFAQGYQADAFFKSKYVEEVPNPNTVVTPSHFWKDPDGLLYFMDADWNSRLCVPSSQVNYVLRWIHDSPYESAHAGTTRFTARLSELFFWKSLLKDAAEFTETCDVCQKIKVDHRKKMGALRPAHIPARPFATVTLDLITGLPPSGPSAFTAILAVVCKLTKFAIIIATHDTLDREGFAKLFVERVANVFGLPDRIIADRDKRWATDFWKSVVAQYGSVMALSSSHHPQTDGQTEVLNATIEQMLRAYVAGRREDWANWLSVVTFAYNSAEHSSSGHSPNFLLFGYRPRLSTTALAKDIDPAARPFLPSQKAETFIATINQIRQTARDALVLAQEKQAKAFNKGRRPVDSISVGDQVLINPHTLKLVDVAGTGKKLVQRTIGPFEVLECINPVVFRLRLPDTYPMHPVFNIAHLKKYKPSPARFGERTTLPSTRNFLASPEYEVEAILGHQLTARKNGNRRMYLVRWAGYGPTDDSWISEYDLRNAPEIKREYLTLHKLV